MRASRPPDRARAAGCVLRTLACCAAIAGLLPSLAAVAAAPAAGTPATPPAAFSGDWLVTRVAVDQADPQNWVFKPQDARLVDRVMTLDAHGRLSFNVTTEACDRVAWSAQPPARLSALVARTFPRGGGRKPPRLADFDLPVADTPLRPFVARCPAAGADAPARWGNAAWFAMLDDRHLGVAYDSDTVLVLERIAPGAPVRPSFDCARASGPAETAICASQALAGYDRSIANAYRQALARADAAARPRLEQAQHAWLATRAACGADERCLSDAMVDRLDLLVQQQ